MMKNSHLERLKIILEPKDIDYLMNVIHDMDLYRILIQITDALVECETDYTNVRDELEALKGEDDDLGYDLDFVQQGGSFIP